jgi:hypothetical protein
LPTAAMVCMQVGELDAARGYVTEAMPLLAGSRRIARVVLLSAAAGIALADGDLGAAVELGTQADADAGTLGIDREIPFIRCVLARAMLDSGSVTAAAATAAGAIAAARSLAFPHPMALCLETAALVILHQATAIRPAASDPDARMGAAGNSPAAAGSCVLREASAWLLAAAQAIRERGDRPGPVTLPVPVAQARLAAGAVTGAVTAGLATSSPPATAPEPAEAADMAVTLLQALATAPNTEQPPTAG